MTRPWLPIPTLVPKAERKAGVVRPNSSATRTSSDMVRPSPPYSSGMERPNSPISRISRDDLVRHLVLPVDLLLERPQPLGDEAADGVEEQVEGFGIEGHCVSSPPCTGEAGVGVSAALVGRPHP